MAAGTSLLQIRRSLESHVGQKIRLRAHRGRRKTLEKVGVLENTYPSIFVVRIDEPTYNQRLSFSYADVLTETVELTLVHKDEKTKLPT
ncbi:MAG: Veg family protein [Dethiobacter sp.]|nr:Veg family protein [Dethiobacter sp.]MBS3982860.1 Veg family protein [Dethiobacter sp.]MCL4462821.1 Veg family protein [Bacillota bacterium]MCL5992619.1 Veg family protein [Bacillota bacterium]